jgi:hypothetical protein
MFRKLAPKQNVENNPEEPVPLRREVQCEQPPMQSVGKDETVSITPTVLNKKDEQRIKC